MNRRIFAILALAIVAIVCAGTVSAFDLGALSGGDDAKSDETQKVTVDGIDFNIPSKLKENKSLELVDEPMSTGEVEYIVNEKTFNDSSDIVSILVADYGECKVTDEVVKLMGGEKTTMGKVTGYLGEDNGLYYFFFPKDDKLVTMVSTSDEIIKDILS